jgi:hypothetical protein
MKMITCPDGRKTVRCYCGNDGCPGWRHVGRYRAGGHCRNLPAREQEQEQETGR